MAKKILYADITSILGGAEKSLLDIIDTIDKSSFTPEVLLFEEGALKEELQKRDIKTYLFNLGIVSQFSRKSGLSILSKIIAAIKAFFLSLKIAFFVRKNNYEVFHSNSYKCHFLSFFVRLFCKTKIIWHLRDISGTSFFAKIFKILAVFIPHVIVANSKATAESIGNSKYVKNKIQVIYNAINFSNYTGGNRKALREKYNIQDTDVVILHAGMFCKLKGQHLIVKLVEADELKDKPVVFFLAGYSAYITGDPELKEYSEMINKSISEKNLENRVIPVGNIENMKDFYAAGDILLSCSTFPESFGRTIIEAMANGIPSVAFDEGGPSEIIEDNITGFLINPYNLKNMCESILELINNKEKRLEMGKSAKEKSFSLYNYRRLGKEIDKLYNALN
jgi:glycosyltransferase involved in cell wall biosynthesis